MEKDGRHEDDTSFCDVLGWRVARVCGLTGWFEGAPAVPGTCSFGESWASRAIAEHIPKARDQELLLALIDKMLDTREKQEKK